MVKFLRNLFDSMESQPADEPLSQDQRQRATAALLVEVACADREFDDEELATLQRILQQQFGLAPSELEDLTAHASERKEAATSLFEFTQLINQHCSPEEKYHLIAAMWEVAFADGNLDKYEEHLIRRVADLIHVSHSDFIHAKLTVKNTQ